MKKLAAVFLLAVAAPLLAAEEPAYSLLSPLRIGEPLLEYNEIPAPFVYEQSMPLGIYIGAMLQPIVLPMDDVGDLDQGDGWALVIGFSPDTIYDPEGILGMELLYARSTHRDPLTLNDAEYTRLSLGFRWWDNTRKQVMPYFAFGTSFSSIRDNPGGIELDGWGFYGGGGVDIFATPNMSIGIDIKLHVWAGDDQFGMVKYGLTPVVGAEFLLHF